MGKSKDVLISVVLSTYNDERYIGDAIESILNQTYSNFEFIIWNDGSTDGTEKIAKSFKDDRIRYFYHENTGLGEALKLACNEVKGRYIARMDADDISSPFRLQKQLEFLEKNPKAILVSSNVEYIDYAGNVKGRSYSFTSSKVIKKRLRKGQNCIFHPASMFRRDAYEKSGGYNALKKAQDLLLFLRMSKFGDLCLMEEPLLKYRITSESISSQTNGNNYFPLFGMYIKKMAADIEVKAEDVSIYNEIVMMSKKENANKAEKVSYRKPAYEIVAYSLSKVIGERCSLHLITELKNIYGALF